MRKYYVKYNSIFYLIFYWYWRMQQTLVAGKVLHTLDLDHLRYKERTPQETAQMLARLRLAQIVPKAVVKPGPVAGVSSGIDMEIDKDPHVTSRYFATGRQFVKPNSVQYSAFDVDQEMCAIMQRVVTTYPASCSESLYQKAVLREAYLSGLPVMVERDVYADYGFGALHVGRVDMEVAGVCLYELKIGKPNIEPHSMQLKKYLKAYDHNKENIQVAKLVYFTPNRVITHVLRDATSAGTVGRAGVAE
jgi:hypothetical protein